MAQQTGLQEGGPGGLVAQPQTGTDSIGVNKNGGDVT